MALKKSTVQSKMKSNYRYGNIIKILLVIIAIVSFIFTFFPDSINKWALNFQPIVNERCLQPFYKDIPPYLEKASLGVNSYPLCFDGFSMMYSDISKTALWVAEVLTPHRLRLMISDQPHTSIDAKNTQSSVVSSAFESKHGQYYFWKMAPIDQTSHVDTIKNSSFTSDMLPLVSQAKRNILLNIEQVIRTIVKEKKVDVYTITGPAFLDSTLKVMDNNVIVPTAVFKVIYIPKTGVMGAYYVPNDLSLNARIVSVCYLEERLGINIFPQLTAEEKRNTYKLPWTEAEISVDHPIEYLYWDAESQCAADVSENDIKKLQKKW